MEWRKNGTILQAAVSTSREHLEVIKPHRERFGPDGGGKRVGLCRKQQRMRSELPLVCS